MAGPLSGIAGQQTVPLSQQQVSQPNQDNNNLVRDRNDQQPQSNEIQPQGAPAAEAQGSETNNQDVLRQQLDALSNADPSEVSENAEARRGSLVDISV